MEKMTFNTIEDAIKYYDSGELDGTETIIVAGRETTIKELFEEQF